jgi:YVTN family beta-propeller protein
LWFTEAGVDEVQVLDTTNNQISATVSVGASPNQLLFTPDGFLVLVVSQSPGELALLDPATNTNIASVKVGDLPYWIAAAGAGQSAYVTNEGSDDVSVVDLTTDTLSDTISVGSAPHEIVIQSIASAEQPQPTPVVPEAPTAPAAPAAGTTDASITDFAFNPAALTVASGQSITWTNMDPDEHTTTSDSPGWDSGPLPQGTSFTTTLNAPGTYLYHCNIHPFMHGTVIVAG